MGQWLLPYFLGLCSARVGVVHVYQSILYTILHDFQGAHHTRTANKRVFKSFWQIITLLLDPRLPSNPPLVQVLAHRLIPSVGIQDQREVIQGGMYLGRSGTR